MKERLISALVALIVLVPTIFIGGNVFLVAVILIGILGLRELIKINKTDFPVLTEILAYISLVTIILGDNSFLSLTKSLCISALLISIPMIFYDKKTYNFVSLVSLYAPAMFLGISFNYLVQIRNSDIYSFIYILLIPILCDTFAYIFGRQVGKHKLLPRVSPKKTIEGSIIGTIISTFVCVIFYLFEIDPAANILVLILLTILLTVAGQLGDLFFSSIKRYYNVKDFSNIMPGHGGILDRLDSLIFVVLFYTIFF